MFWKKICLHISCKSDNDTDNVVKETMEIMTTTKVVVDDAKSSADQ